MAQAVRNNEELLAVRLRVEMSSKGLRLIADCFRGEDKLGSSLTMLLTELGYSEEWDEKGSNKMYLPEGGHVPPRLEEFFGDVADRLDGSEAIWLQIDYGSDILAAFPWEKNFSEQISRLMLRIPNFARNTYNRAEADESLAICAATPRAKGAPEWGRPLERFLKNLHTSQPIVLYLNHEQIGHVFSDWGHFREQFPHLNLRLAPQPQPNTSPQRETFISTRKDVVNPWLRWILDDQLADGAAGVHSVHFICTGYAQNRHGALALPVSPYADNDSGWARFVGASEFTTFADQLKCEMLGFTALGAPKWQEGIRLFINELSWKRPGPTFANFTGEQAASVYNALLHDQHFSTAPAADLAFYVHPKAISEEQKRVPIKRSMTNFEKADFSVELERLQAQPRSIQGQRLPNELIRVMDQLSSAKPKSPLRSARDRGTLRAMEFLTKLSNSGDVK